MGIITHYSSSFLQPNILGLSQSLRSYVAVVSAVPNPISHERDPILQLSQQSSTVQQRTMGLETVIIFLAAFGLVALSKSLVIDRFRRRCIPTPKVQLGGAIPAADFKRRPSQDVAQYELPPLRTGARVMPQMAMALKKLDQINWLTLDANYLPEHNLRSSLLKTCHSNVVQTLPQSKAACHEVLSMTIDFLTTRYPTSFSVTSSPPTIHNHLTSESFPIGPNITNPLEIAARLSMEDFNILQKDPESGEYCLNASATLFPTGWKLQERIGFSMASLHAPVPGWKEKLGRSVHRYFDHLSPSSCMERTNLFIQTSSSLFIDTPTAMFPHLSPLTPDHIQVRRERQTFTRLVETDAVLFTVRTFMRSLTELDLEETKAFAEMVRGWETTEMGKYKGSDVWGETALAWCDDRIAKAEAGN